MAQKKREFYWSGGPKPSTTRGKRRHADRDKQAASHAQKVWDGGYTPAKRGGTG